MEHTLSYVEAALRGYVENVNLFLQMTYTSFQELFCFAFITLVMFVVCLFVYLLSSVPCNRIFVAHYEHILAEPAAYVEPLSNFLELDGNEKEVC